MTVLLTAGFAVAAAPRALAADNVVLVWDEAIIQAIIPTRPGPTVAARQVAVVHTAMYDAWAAYDATAVPTMPHRGWRVPEADRTDANKAEAVSFAAYRALTDLFPSQKALFDSTLVTLGYDKDDVGLENLATPAGIGEAAAEEVLAFRHHDGSNQLGDLAPGAYSDYTGYAPVNTPTQLIDPNRWQPLLVPSGTQLVEQKYTTPQWGLVTPFALTSGSQFRPAQGPARYPSLAYAEQAQALITISAGLNDYEKTIAEFWADNSGTWFPPGHWAFFGQWISRRDGHTLDQDVKMFFALGNALLDASIACWDAKRVWDSVRPISAIPFLFAGRTILAWAGPYQGTQAIDGANWKPYQIPGNITPPFPEFFSGHSTFSAAAAEVLRSFTGSDSFAYSITFPAGSSSAEPGAVPATNLTVTFATFSDAADSAGMSRRYGGIHFQDGDLNGRATGRLVGAAVWAKAESYWNGTAPQELPLAEPSSRAPAVVTR
ncbi:MAG TPA: vanadium-dependent haloperoxidase [Thermoanaerobaculia bacterium]